MEKERVRGVLKWLANIMVWASEDIGSRLEPLASELKRNSQIIRDALMEAIDDDLRPEAAKIAGLLTAGFTPTRPEGEGEEVAGATEGEENSGDKGSDKPLREEGGGGRTDSGVAGVH